jgi:alpha-L-fucosidase
MWPTKYSFNWNAMAVGPKRDLIGMFRFILDFSIFVFL